MTINDPNERIIVGVFLGRIAEILDGKIRLGKRIRRKLSDDDKIDVHL